MPALLAAAPPRAAPARGLRWEDPQTERVLFTVEDVVRFDWDRQVFELTRPAAMDAMAYLYPHGRQYRAFAVRDEAGVIYRGRCFSMGSSLAYDGPTLVAGTPAAAPPLFAVEGGYPAGGGRRDRERFAPRLRAALAEAGVLRPIPPAAQARPLARLATPWHGDKKTLRVRADIFPETLRLGSEARAHLFLAPGAAGLPDLESVEIHSRLTQNEERFFCTTAHAATPAAVSNGVHVIRWRPWGPVYGAIEPNAKAGPAQLAFAVIARRKTGAGPPSVLSVRLPAQEVTVLPCSPARAAERFARAHWLHTYRGAKPTAGQGRLLEFAACTNADTVAFFPAYYSCRLVYGDVLGPPGRAHMHRSSLGLLVRGDKVAQTPSGSTDAEEGWHPLPRIEGSGARVESRTEAGRAMRAYAALLQLPGAGEPRRPPARDGRKWRCEMPDSLRLELVVDEHDRLLEAGGQILRLRHEIGPPERDP
jgi:hypothetical protein